MKNLLAVFTLFAFLTIPVQGAFAWSYEGPNSLNPFTGFRQCNKCVKVEKVKCKCKCKKPKLTKCEKLNGVKIKNGQVCGCAAPIQQPKCMRCERAF